MLYCRGPPIMLTPAPLTTKAKQIKSVGLVNMNQRLKVTNYSWPY